MNKAISISSSGSFLLLCASVSPAAFALDSALVGSWSGTMKTSRGTVSATWTINPNGSYTAHFEGPQAIPDDQGELVADGGRWRRRGAQSSESGSYSIPGPGRFITIGSNGMTEWKRSGAGASSSSATTAAGSTQTSGAKYSPMSNASAKYAPSANGSNPSSVAKSSAYANGGNAPSRNYAQSSGSTSFPPTAPSVANRPKPASGGMYSAFGAFAANQRSANSNAYSNNAYSAPNNSAPSNAYSASSNAYSPARNAVPARKSEPQHVPGAYDPRWNPANFASQTAPQDNGYYQAPPTRAFNPYAPQSSQPSGPPMQISGSLQSLLYSDFPLPAVGDEVQQYGLPALGRAAAGGMKKRDFRMIY